MSPSVHRRPVTPLLVALLALGVLAALRVAQTPPAWFVEGDDAALCLGVARLNLASDVGPYFSHPPSAPAPPLPSATLTADLARAAADRPSARFYRYDTMPGMYLLGRLAGGPAAATAPRLGWICFVAGTLFPLLLAAFLCRVFTPLPRLAFPLAAILIAMAPECWIGGSAYINDKIVAATALAAALLATTAGKSDGRRAAWFAFASALFGAAVLFRFDTICFLPAAALALWLHTRPTWRARALATGAAMGGAATVYLLGMVASHASLAGALSAGASLVTRSPPLEKVPVLLSAYGWTSLPLFGGLLLLLVARLVWSRLRRDRTDRTPTASAPWFESRALLLPLLAGALLLPEVGFVFSLPFTSQKYLFVSAAVLAGLTGILPFLLAPRLAGLSTPRTRAAAIAIAAAVLGVSLTGGLHARGLVSLGSDGHRPIGGHLRYRLAAYPDALVAERLVGWMAAQPEDARMSVIVPRPPWLLEQALACACLARGWSNSIVATGAELSPAAAPGKSAGKPVRLSLNRYAPLGGSVELLLAGDFDAVHHADILTHGRMLAEAEFAPLLFDAGAGSLVPASRELERGTLEIVATGNRPEGAPGAEVWLLALETSEGMAALAGNAVTLSPGWESRTQPDGRPYLICVRDQPATAAWTGSSRGFVGVRLLKHAWSGEVRFRWNGRPVATFDLHSEKAEELYALIPLNGQPPITLPDGPVAP